MVSAALPLAISEISVSDSSILEIHELTESGKSVKQDPANFSLGAEQQRSVEKNLLKIPCRFIRNCSISKFSTIKKILVTALVICLLLSEACPIGGIILIILCSAFTDCAIEYTLEPFNRWLLIRCVIRIVSCFLFMGLISGATEWVGIGDIFAAVEVAAKWLGHTHVFAMAATFLNEWLPYVRQPVYNDLLFQKANQPTDKSWRNWCDICLSTNLYNSGSDAASAIDMQRINFSGSSFIQSSFSNPKIKNVQFDNTYFEEVSFAGDGHQILMENVSFTKAKIRNLRINANCRNVSFRNAVINGFDTHDALVGNLDLRGAQIKAWDIRNCPLNHAKFDDKSHIDLSIKAIFSEPNGLEDLLTAIDTIGHKALKRALIKQVMQKIIANVDAIQEDFACFANQAIFNRLSSPLYTQHSAFDDLVIRLCHYKYQSFKETELVRLLGIAIDKANGYGGVAFIQKNSMFIAQLLFQAHNTSQWDGRDTDTVVDIKAKRATLAAVAATCEPFKSVWIQYLNTNIMSVRERIHPTSDVGKWLQHLHGYYLIMAADGKSCIVVDHDYFKHNIAPGHVDQLADWKDVSYYAQITYSASLQYQLQFGKDNQYWGEHLESGLAYPLITQRYKDSQHSSFLTQLMDALIPEDGQYAYYNIIIKRALRFRSMGSYDLTNEKHQHNLGLLLLDKNESRIVQKSYHGSIHHQWVTLKPDFASDVLGILKNGWEESPRSDQEKAYVFLCLSAIFCTLCSDTFFGNGSDQTPLAMRKLALACLNYAYGLQSSLGPGLISWHTVSDWRARFAGDKCADALKSLIYRELQQIRAQQNTERYRALYDKVIPELWRDYSYQE